MAKWDLSQEWRADSTQEKSINVIYRIDRKRKKTPRRTSKAEMNTQWPFRIKIPRKIGIEGNLLNMIKNISGKPTATSYSMA